MPLTKHTVIRRSLGRPNWCSANTPHVRLELIIQSGEARRRATASSALTAMDQNPSVISARALVRKLAIQKAAKLSGLRAYEIWQAMQLLSTNGSLANLSDAVVQLALDFNQAPAAWKVIADKALEYEHLTVDRKP